MPVTEGGGIFVSYRRQESSHLAGRLADRLADRFGEGQVFMDVDTIEPGVDFAEEIFRAVAACKVLLAIIGSNWLTATDARGRRRLDDPDDIVRLEIEAALARGVRVIPILVEAAVMPDRDDLPESLAGLARRNALLIRHESFRYDTGRLVTAIERVLEAPGTAAVSAAPDDARRGRNAVGAVAQKGPGPFRIDPDRTAHDSASSDGTLTGARLEAAVGQLERSIAGLREMGYELKLPKVRPGKLRENYIRIMDPRYTAHGIGYITPTYFGFTRASDREILLSQPSSEPLTSAVKFSHVESAQPGLNAAKLLKS